MEVVKKKVGEMDSFKVLLTDIVRERKIVKPTLNRLEAIAIFNGKKTTSQCKQFRCFVLADFLEKA